MTMAEIYVQEFASLPVPKLTRCWIQPYAAQLSDGLRLIWLRPANRGWWWWGQAAVFSLARNLIQLVPTKFRNFKVSSSRLHDFTEEILLICGNWCSVYLHTDSDTITASQQWCCYNAIQQLQTSNNVYAGVPKGSRVTPLGSSCMAEHSHKFKLQ